MDKALQELKIKAKRLLKTSRTDDSALDGFQSIAKKQRWDLRLPLKLKDSQNLLALQCGFNHWQHAQQILSGAPATVASIDFGTFWHQPACDALINQWFADYDEASAAQQRLKDSYLLPFKTQFVVCGKEYLGLLGIAASDSELLAGIGNDLVNGYGTPTWDSLALRVIKHKSQVRSQA